MSTPPTLDDRQQACLRPGDPVVMFQKWKDLLFLHWEVSAEQVRKTLPEGLTVDLHEGKCYLGLVPFYMCDIRPRFLPAVAGISNFLEMNVRTYVHDEHGNPGVWFYSLDANQSLAVALAKRFFHLPYFRAEMSATRSGAWIDYQCERRDRPGEHSGFRYRGGDPLPPPQPGSLEYFLLERYFLFAFDARRKRLLSGQVHHRPYPVHEAVVEAFSPLALSQAGFPEAGFAVGAESPCHAAFSPGVSVEIFGIKEVPGTAR